MIQTKKRKLRVRLRELPHEVAKKVLTFRVDDGGFQRKLARNKVDSVKGYLENTPWAVFPPVLIADVNGVLYDVDGQHRRLAHVELKRPLVASVVKMSMEDARRNFMLHNSKATRVGQSDLIQASRNPIAQSLKKLAKRFSATDNQVRRLIAGLEGGLSTRQLNFIDDDAKLDPVVMEKAISILETWTQSPLWDPKNFGIRPAKAKDVYAAAGVLHLIGALAKETPIKKLPKLVRIFQTANFGKTGWLFGHYGASVGDVCRMFPWAMKYLLRNGY